MYRLAGIFAPILIAGAFWLAGCSVDTELGGVKVPNARPDTKLTGQPPTLLEASFTVDFNWDGFDPDGRVVGFEWKISDNGQDGISVRDTLTRDPMTGQTLHPWHFTSAYDTTFVVMADQADFPGDEIEPRSFRTHTLFIRSVDDQGARDPSPAQVSFTATTLVPRVQIGKPFYESGATDAKLAPPTVTVVYQGEDPDYADKFPAQVRWMWKPATYSGGSLNDPYIINWYTYKDYFEEVVDFGSDQWEDWVDYPRDEENRRIIIPDRPLYDDAGKWIGYLLALQVKDVAGAVSVGRGYMTQVGNFKLKHFWPAVTLYENSSIHGYTTTNRTDIIAAYQPIQFSWKADLSHYLGEVVAYRYGWNVFNPDDPYDDGWAIPPGVSPQHMSAPETSFEKDVNTFTLKVTDNSNQSTVVKWVLSVIPYVDRDKQSPLLVIDGVDDDDSHAWEGAPLGYDNQAYRNLFWMNTLVAVDGFVWEEDRFDHVEAATYEDVVNYKAVLIPAYNGQGVVLQKFQTRPEYEQFIWLEPYQRRGGNLLFCGALGQYGFLENKANYMVPIIFTSNEAERTFDDRQFTTGFGTRTLADGSEIERGIQQYPYRTAGIAVLDWTAPETANIYDRPLRARYDRRPGCAGLKALVLDQDFRAEYEVPSGATGIPDTIYTNAMIDWKDEFYYDEDLLDYDDTWGLYTWGQDEFYDVNITSTCPTPYRRQTCLDAPSGYCAEAMFRGVARFDWLRERRWADGDLEWPNSTYSDLDAVCGEMALTSYEGVPDRSALTNGRMFGFISYKMFSEKDWGKADVYWGFDPYRFDHATSRQAIHWVLRYFGLQINPLGTDLPATK